MKGAPIVLTTDFGQIDEYVGVLKGVILSINPEAAIIDLSHAIPPQDIGRAAALISRNHKYFPATSIHLCIVDPGVGTDRRIIVVEACSQVFLGPDNGIFSRIFEADEMAKVYELTNRNWFLEEISNTFHGRDIMAPTAARLSLGASIGESGPSVTKESCLIIAASLPLCSDSEISGEIITIDRFGNLITNIEKIHLDRLVLENGLKIRINSSAVRFNQTSYENLPEHLPAALLNSNNLLEICIKNGSAADILDVKIGDKILVTGE
ncbi:MAG: SAM hydrolase/SAM-dependent halogenase family protein [Desulfocapsaceae bacterium]